MAFLDNSGDIILDAVLTDEGRRRLAKGDGSFKIVKFALGDDEIDYSLYNGSHPSGSAYYDLDLLRTPVLEAFTNNIASLNTKLISLPRTDLLFLPVIKINTYITALATEAAFANAYVVPVDASSTPTLATTALLKNITPAGVLKPQTGVFMQFDQGLDTTKYSYLNSISPDLIETEYNVIIDNRLGYLVDKDGMALDYVSIDDDGYAMYNFARNIDSVVTDNTNTSTPLGVDQIIAGPRGTILRFSIRPSLNLVDNYLFDTLGRSVTAGATFWEANASASVRSIKTTIQIEGVTTGYSLSVPVYFIKR